MTIIAQHGDDGEHWGSEARVRTALLAVKATPRAKLCVVGLLAFRNLKTGRCDPSERRLAEVLGCDERTVRRGLIDAEGSGMISILHRPGRSSCYVVHDGQSMTPSIADSFAPVRSDRSSSDDVDRTGADTLGVDPGQGCPSNSVEQAQEQSEEQSPTPALSAKGHDLSEDQLLEAKRMIRKHHLDFAHMDQHEFGVLMFLVARLRDGLKINGRRFTDDEIADALAVEDGPEFDGNSRSLVAHLEAMA